VTSSGANCRLNDSQIFVEWDAVMVDTAINKTDYWVTAGAVYNSQSEVWIDSEYFTALQDTYNGVSAKTILPGRLSNYSWSIVYKRLLTTSRTYLLF
jgi:hypothetical protein